MNPYYAFATDTDADCNNYLGLGDYGKEICKAGKGAKKQITGEGTALDPKVLEKRDKEMTTPTASNPDADCNTWGPFAPLCVGGKSITKGFGGLGKWFSNPWILPAVAVAVVVILVILIKR